MIPKLYIGEYRDPSDEGKIYLINRIRISSVLYAIEMKNIKSVHIQK